MPFARCCCAQCRRVMLGSYFLAFRASKPLPSSPLVMSSSVAFVSKIEATGRITFDLPELRRQGSPRAADAGMAAAWRLLVECLTRCQYPKLGSYSRWTAKTSGASRSRTASVGWRGHCGSRMTASRSMSTSVVTRDYLQARLCARLRGHCVQTAWLALPRRSISSLAEDQKTRRRRRCEG
jgi:hypothetical protein